MLTMIKAECDYPVKPNQIVAYILGEMFQNKDPKIPKKVMEALPKMSKIDIKN